MNAHLCFSCLAFNSLVGRPAVGSKQRSHWLLLGEHWSTPTAAAETTPPSLRERRLFRRACVSPGRARTHQTVCDLQIKRRGFDRGLVRLAARTFLTKELLCVE